jgi:hypothetical protein
METLCCFSNIIWTVDTWSEIGTCRFEGEESLSACRLFLLHLKANCSIEKCFAVVRSIPSAMKNDDDTVCSL